MNAVAINFADGSNHLFSGCIGTVDGWIVKIQKPSRKDGLLNPKSFYSWKGFYGLSIQAIVDKKKHVLFRLVVFSAGIAPLAGRSGIGISASDSGFRNSGN